MVLTTETAYYPTVTEEEVKRLREALDTVEDAGADALRRTRSLKQRFEAGIREYRDRASGRDDFGSYVEFRSIAAAVEEAVEDEEDVYGAEVLEKAAARFDRRTMREKHFDRAEEDLTELEDAVQALDTAEEMRSEVESLRHRLSREIGRLEDEIDELEHEIERAERYADVDYTELVEMLESYNENVREDFRSFRDQVSAADVVRLGARAGEHPFVPGQPVSLEDADRLEEVAGDRSAEEVLEIMEHSKSKLEHYVDSAVEFRRAVPRSFLEGFDGSAFEIDFDEAADVVRYEAPELLKEVSKFADEETIDLLRRIRRLAMDDDYERMRKAYVDAGDVDVDELRQQKTEVEAEIEEVRRQLRDVEDELERATEVLD